MKPKKKILFHSGSSSQFTVAFMATLLLSFCNQHFKHELSCPSHGWDSSTREAKKLWRISLEAEDRQNTYLTQSLHKYLLAPKVSALEKQL